MRFNTPAVTCRVTRMLACVFKVVKLVNSGSGWYVIDEQGKVSLTTVNNTSSERAPELTGVR